MKREIFFYQKDSGDYPVQQFLGTLNPEIVKKIFFVFDLIEELDVVPSKFFKKLKGASGIWEVRVEYESNIYRLFGFLHKNSLVILTNAYQKKSQKTDNNQIKQAEIYKNDFLLRER